MARDTTIKTNYDMRIEQWNTTQPLCWLLSLLIAAAANSSAQSSSCSNRIKYATIHGQYYDFGEVARGSGQFGGDEVLVPGDYVDRGSFSIEVLLLLFALKVTFPSSGQVCRIHHGVLLQSIWWIAARTLTCPFWVPKCPSWFCRTLLRQKSYIARL